MATPATPNIDAAAAVADMESELQQLRQQNKELRSTVELLTNRQQQQQQQPTTKKDHKKKSSIGNNTDDSYQLYRTPDHTPTPSDDSEACNNSKLKGGVPHNLSEVEMGNLQQPRLKLTQKVKKNNDGGGDYARASSRSFENEGEPPICTINSDDNKSNIMHDQELA